MPGESGRFGVRGPSADGHLRARRRNSGRCTSLWRARSEARNSLGVSPVFLVCFFPIVLNAILAFGSLSEELTRFCRATGAGAWRRFVKVRLPAAMLQCFVGFKYAAINATVGATIAEFIGSDQVLAIKSAIGADCGAPASPPR